MAYVQLQQAVVLVVAALLYQTYVAMEYAIRKQQAVVPTNILMNFTIFYNFLVSEDAGDIIRFFK